MSRQKRWKENKQSYGNQRGQLGRMLDKLGAWDYQIHSTIYKIVSDKDLLYRTGNYTQHLVIIYNGKEYKNIYIYIGLLWWSSG